MASCVLTLTLQAPCHAARPFAAKTAGDGTTTYSHARNRFLRMPILPRPMRCSTAGLSETSFHRGESRSVPEAAFHRTVGARNRARQVVTARKPRAVPAGNGQWPPGTGPPSCKSRAQTKTPKIRPTSAVIAIAAAPQNSTRAVARSFGAPPALAPKAPSPARLIRVATTPAGMITVLDRHRLSGPRQAAGGHVDRQLAQFDARIGVARIAARHRPDPCGKLAQVKGLDQIVVRHRCAARCQAGTDPRRGRPPRIRRRFSS